MAVLDRITRHTRSLVARFSPAAEDAAAEAMGWQVERGRFARRTYRDARFIARRAAAMSELPSARRAEFTRGGGP